MAESKSLSLRGIATKALLLLQKGANREVAVCDEEKRIYLMDGVKEGGEPVAMLSDLKAMSNEDLAEGTSEIPSLVTAEQLGALGGLNGALLELSWSGVSDEINMAPRLYGFYLATVSSVWVTGSTRTLIHWNGAVSSSGMHGDGSLNTHPGLIITNTNRLRYVGPSGTWGNITDLHLIK